MPWLGPRATLGRLPFREAPLLGLGLPASHENTNRRHKRGFVSPTRDPTPFLLTQDLDS